MESFVCPIFFTVHWTALQQYLRLKVIKINNLSFVKTKDQERLNKKAVVTDCTCIGNMTQTWEKTQYTESNQGSKITPYHPPFVLALNLSYLSVGKF